MGFVKLLKNGARILGTDTYSAGINGVNSLLGGYINEYFADRARKKNFEYNEKAAVAADERQRKQYADLYSPQAMMQQYAAAGLSPSMMMSGGQSAVGGTPQGNMSASLSGAYPSAGGQFIDPLKAAQIDNLRAQTEGIRSDNKIKNMETELRELKFILDKGELELMSTWLTDKETGENTSLWDSALNSNNLEDFKNHVLKHIDFENQPYAGAYIKTTKGRETLQTIYSNARKLNADLAKFENDKEYAELFAKYYSTLNTLDYAKISAKQIITELKAQTESSELAEEKKKAINDMLNSIESDNARAVVMLLMMLGDRLLGQVNASISNTTSKVIKK